MVEFPFDDFVFEGLIAHEHSHAAGVQPSHHLADDVFQGLQFAVDFDPQCLEGSFRWMSAGAAGCCRNGRVQEFYEAGRGSKRLFFPFAENRAGNLAGKSFFTICLEYPGQVSVTVGVEDVGCGEIESAIHSHVEWCIDGVCKAALGLVQLHRGNTEVVKEARNASFSNARVELAFLDEGLDGFIDGVETGVEAAESVTKSSEAFVRLGQCVGVAVESDHGRGWEGFQECLRVPSCSEGAVDNDGMLWRLGSVYTKTDVFDHAVAHHRHVAVLALLVSLLVAVLGFLLGSVCCGVRVQGVHSFLCLTPAPPVTGGTVVIVVNFRETTECAQGLTGVGVSSTMGKMVERHVVHAGKGLRTLKLVHHIGGSFHWDQPQYSLRL